MEQRLEPLERLAVGEDDLRDRGAVDLAGLVENPVAEALDERLPDTGSSRSRRWTISSLETVAAPWRLNESSASLFPAPMPPVMATAIGLAKLVGARAARPRSRPGPARSGEA